MQALGGQVALVTGGGSGIGRSAALALAQAGARVVVAGRRVAAGEETVRQVTEAGGEAAFVRADVRREADVAGLVQKTVKRFGRLDIAFNNAGTEGALRPLTEATEPEYETVFDTNVRGVWLSMKYQIPALREAGGGVIINNASIAGVVGLQMGPLYAASKHAVIGLTRSAALAHAREGIRINAVSPGVIDTDSYERFTGGDREVQAGLAKAHPVGRVGLPEEIAQAVVWLSSPGASFVTGHNMMIDGGYTAQ